MYLSRGLGHCELISFTLSVTLSIVRSLRGGTSTWEGSIVGEARQNQVVGGVFESSLTGVTVALDQQNRG